jgi:hypothetical protein
MWTRIGIAALLACLLALSISIALASANPYPVGRAAFGTVGNGAPGGEAYVRRQLTAGTTQVQVRLYGLAAGTSPGWRLEIGAFCGTPSKKAVITSESLRSVNSLGTLMTVETFPTTIDVGSSMMTFRVYSSIRGGVLGPQLGCAQVINQPNLGSQHWW